VTAQFPAPCCGNVAYIMTPSQTLILVLTARGVQLQVSLTHKLSVIYWILSSILV